MPFGRVRHTSPVNAEHSAVESAGAEPAGVQKGDRHVLTPLAQRVSAADRFSPGIADDSRLRAAAADTPIRRATFPYLPLKVFFFPLFFQKGR